MSITDKILKILSQNNQKIAESDLNKTFSELSINTLDFIELVMAIEAEFSIDVHDDDAESLQTPLELIALLEKIQLAEESPKPFRANEREAMLFKQSV